LRYDLIRNAKARYAIMMPSTRRVMHRAFGIFAVLSGLLSATPSQAATWWLVVVADGKGTYDSEYSFQLPMDSEEQCEVAGTKLELSAKSGKFDQKGTDYMMYECVLGK